MAEAMRRLEFRLIDSLKKGDAGEGTLGSAAGHELKRLPSTVYWAMVGAWRIRTRDYSPGEFFANAARLRDLVANNPATDDPESRGVTSEEAEYLTDRITA